MDPCALVATVIETTPPNNENSIETRSSFQKKNKKMPFTLTHFSCIASTGSGEFFPTYSIKYTSFIYPVCPFSLIYSVKYNILDF